MHTAPSIALVAREDVEMQMRHHLPTGRVMVPADVEAIRVKNFLDSPHGLENSNHDLFILLFIQVKDSISMHFGNDDGMPRSVRFDVQKGEAAFIFIDFVAGNLAIDDAAEGAVGHLDLGEGNLYISYSFSSPHARRPHPNQGDPERSQPGSRSDRQGVPRQVR